MIVQLPFEGFYQGTYDYLTSAEFLDIPYSDENLLEHFMGSDFKSMRTEISKLYVKVFDIALKDKIPYQNTPKKLLTFNHLWSPDYYNFHTDEIYINISKKNLKLLYNKVDLETFKKAAIKAYTSTDGYIPPNISPNIDYWGHFNTWTQRQYSLIIDCLVHRDTVSETLLDEYYPEIYAIVLRNTTKQFRKLYKQLDC